MYLSLETFGSFFIVNCSTDAGADVLANIVM